MGEFRDRLKHAWNAFIFNEKATTGQSSYTNYGPSYGLRPDRSLFRGSTEKSIISSIITRISIDAAAIDMMHVRLDEDGRFLEQMKSGLNRCLTVEANIDQSARAFRQDIYMSLLEEGTVAIVPIDTTYDPIESGTYDVNSMRVGKIVAWYPEHVRVSVWNQKRGVREELTVPKRIVAIVENPLFSVMNEPNSILQRLIRKLNYLDVIDEQSSSGKLDIIVQLPYSVRTETRREAAEVRRKDIEMQLKGSQYGIAYIDQAERITQLNRPAENNLLSQIEYLTEMLYSQIGLTKEVMNGSADENTMLNYYYRTVEPILISVAEALKRTFITKTAQTQNQSIKYYRDPFKLVPISTLADIADKFTRNEILSSNEFRDIIGRKPVLTSRADSLMNKNMPAGDLTDPSETESTES